MTILVESWIFQSQQVDRRLALVVRASQFPGFAVLI